MNIKSKFVWIKTELSNKYKDFSKVRNENKLRNKQNQLLNLKQIMKYLVSLSIEIVNKKICLDVNIVSLFNFV